MAEQEQQQMQMNVDVKNTTSIETPSGGVVFQQGVLLRKVSKFVVGAEEDAIMPIPVFYDTKTGKILEATIPADLREEYKDHIIS
jgi:hypothetical protein|tara:strand:+ start:3906 stop:4160 length:255 start_codon:yes stop_codon:yes gene_type:complete